MEYFFIFLFQTLGIAASVGQTVYGLDKHVPEKSAREIFNLFIENEWSSLLISIIILVTDVSFHLLLNTYFPQWHSAMVHVPIIDIDVPFVVASILASFILGYGGQWLFYKWLNKGKEYLIKKAE